MSQNSTQSTYEQCVAVASKLTGVLEQLESAEEEADAADAAEGPELARPGGRSRRKRSRRTPRVSRKEARARLKLRLESIPGFNRHSRKCQICNHPEIEELEDEFLNWASAHWIKKAFKLSDESTIYRHARATGLDAVRRENLGMALEKIVQEIDHLETPTVTEVIRAVRTLARINSSGQWVFPPATQISNRQTPPELEIDVTGTKQTTEVTSNRQS